MAPVRSLHDRGAAARAKAEWFQVVSATLVCSRCTIRLLRWPNLSGSNFIIIRVMSASVAPVRSPHDRAATARAEVVWVRVAMAALVRPLHHRGMASLAEVEWIRVAPAARRTIEARWRSAFGG